MAKPLTKPIFEPEIHVNKPLSPSVTPATAANPADDVRSPEGIHAIPSRRSREPESETAGIASKVQEKASAAYDELAARSNDAVLKITRNTAEMLRPAGRRVRYILNGYPLRVIGVVAGTAFVAGVVLRVWRSSHE